MASGANAESVVLLKAVPVGSPKISIQKKGGTTTQKTNVLS